MNLDEIAVIRQHLNAMLDDLGQLGGANQGGTSMQATPTVATHDLPASWHHVESRTNETYSWPGLLEEYTTFDVYESRSASGRPMGRWAIGECERTAVWGRDRKYLIVFKLGGGGGSKQPICEFLEADDFSTTHELVAIIRGSGGPRGQRMFDPEAELPPYYAGLRVETYRDRISGTPRLGSWNKLAVVAHKDDSTSMLLHAAIQVLLRH